jgi:hypothetical protein
MKFSLTIEWTNRQGLTRMKVWWWENGLLFRGRGVWQEDES